MELTLSCDYDEVASLSCALLHLVKSVDVGMVDVCGVCVVVGGSCIVQ